MTTALMALFAACTNDDFISNEQGIQSGDAAMRPTVDVTLNVLGDGADTRLAFDGEEGYQWQTNDTIGALLMDKVLGKTRPHQEDWKDLVWTEKYALVDYINTDYPFVRQSDGTWQTNAKMLEGNYFFSFPYASYTGNREAVHSLGEQIQDGTSTEALREAYAKNQFFVGYARIHAGTEGGDVMSADLEMTPMLGAVGITIKNVGTESLQVKKIVLQSEAFSTLIKIDPTMANYDGENGDSDYNLDALNELKYQNPAWDGAPVGGGYFNYANYEEMQRTGDTWTFIPEFKEQYASGNLVNNTEKSANYNRQEALRAVVNPITEGVGADDRAELTVLNAPVQKSQEEANFLIMTNIYENGTTDEIKAYVYTDRGMAGPVVISSVKGEIEVGASGNGVTSVITNNPIVEIAPGVTNKVTLEIDNNSVQDPENMNTYNEEDLLQFIEWNQDKSRVYTATLQNDVVLTKEMTDLLTAKGVTSKLRIYTNGKKLYIDEDAAANILDYVYVSKDKNGTDAATVIVNNDLVLGSASLVSGTHTPGSIHQGNITLSNKLEVAEGASVTVSSDIKYLTNGDHKYQALTIAKNEGTVTINGAVDKLTIAENKAEVEINKNVTFAGDSKNVENAVITIGEGATVNCGNATTSYLWNVGKKDEYAVIYNNGTIMNLDNKAWGKVIAGAKSTTNVNDNVGIIDISSSIKANWKINNTNTGHVSYTATAAQTVSITDVKNSLITELVLDGGTITAVDAETGKDKSADATATSVTKIVVKENGGVLGEAEKNEAGTKIHERTSFPSVTKVETNGDVTFYDVDLAAATKFDVKAGTTTIKGTVDAKEATFTLGSYDDKQYVAHDGTLSIPTKFDELNAAQITKKSGTGHDTEFDAVVMNQGLVNLPEGVQHGVGDGWKGNKPGEITSGETGTPDKVESQGGVYTVNADNLIEDAKKDFSEVTAIKITSGLTPTEDQYNALKTIVSGKELILTNGTLSLGNGDGNLSAEKLTVEGENVGVSTTNGVKNVVMLTVNSVEVKSEAALIVYDAWILVNQNVRKGSSTGLRIDGTVTYNADRPGAIVAINNADTAGAYLEMNTTSKKWE